MAFSEFWFCPYLHIFPLFHKKRLRFDSACPDFIITPSPPHIGVLVRKAVIPKPPKRKHLRFEYSGRYHNELLLIRFCQQETRDLFVLWPKRQRRRNTTLVGQRWGDLYWTLHGARDGLFQDSRVFARTGYQRRTRHSLGEGNMDVGD